MKAAIVIVVVLLGVAQSTSIATTNDLEWRSVFASDVIVAARLKVRADAIRDAGKVPRTSQFPPKESYVPIGLEEVEVLQGKGDRRNNVEAHLAQVECG